VSTAADVAENQLDADPHASASDRLKMAGGDVISGVADTVDNPAVTVAANVAIVSWMSCVHKYYIADWWFTIVQNFKGMNVSLLLLVYSWWNIKLYICKIKLIVELIILLLKEIIELISTFLKIIIYIVHILVHIV